jgi:hypothetical protein
MMQKKKKKNQTEKALQQNLRNVSAGIMFIKYQPSELMRHLGQMSFHVCCFYIQRECICSRIGGGEGKE